MKTSITFGCLVLALLGMMLLAGCDSGPAVAPVTGLVTQDGEPLAGAMVEFQPDKGAPSYGYTDENGRYEMNYQTDRKGALLGHHYISVRTEGEVTDPKTDMTVNVPETVPAEYNEETNRRIRSRARQEHVRHQDRRKTETTRTWPSQLACRS